MRSLVIGIGLLLSCHAWAQATKVGSGIQVVPHAAAPGKETANSAYWTNSADANKPYYTTPASADSPLMTPSYTSSAADGAGAVAVSINTSTTWANPVAHLLKLANNTIEKFAVYAASGLIESSWARNIGIAQTVGLNLENTTAALAGTQQYSPAVDLVGRGWETTGGTSQPTGWMMQAQPVSSALSRSSLAFYHNSNGVITKAVSFEYGSILAGSFVITAQGGYIGIFDNALNGLKIDPSGNVVSRSGSADVFEVRSAAVIPTNDHGITSGDLTHRFSTVFTRHLAGGQNNVPTCVAGTGAGTGATCSTLSGSTDLSGTLEIVAGTAPSTASTVTTVTFEVAYNVVPRCAITPANASAQGIITVSPFVNQASGSTTTFVLTSGSAAITASTTYQYNYECIE